MRGLRGDGMKFCMQHGHAAKRTATYRSWVAMLTRCNNPKHQDYCRYGGRGVRVCDRWSVFENFLADMGERPQGRSLNRINNKGNYEPGNCNWATPREQSSNTRKAKLLTHQGLTLCIAEWARRLGLSPFGMQSRVKRGAPEHELFKPKVRR